MKGKCFKIGKLVCGLILLTILAQTKPISAQTNTTLDPGFNPNSIITDDDMFNVYSMNKDYLISFLKTKGKLASIKVMDIDGVEKTAADVIWRVAQSYKINPKYLLVLLQKEQSLVEDSSPSQKQLDWAAGYAVCDSCSMDDPDIQAFKGFANQMEWAAKQHREKYLMQLLAFGVTISGKGVGKSMEIDGQIIIPANNATAMLYTYTPHIHGNYNLWKIWRRWFSLAYPNGTIARAMPSKKTYLIQNGQKKEFINEAILLSMTNPDKIIESTDNELNNYPDGEPVKFSKYSLIKTELGNIYLITGTGKRLFSTLAAFQKFGFIEDEIIEAQEKDLDDLALLDPITEETSFPQGALVKTPQSSTVWYVENGVKQALLDEVFLKLYFTRRPIKTVAINTVESYKLGEPYKLLDGELVRGVSAPDVYVVENGDLRPIQSAEVFESMGWNWNNIVMVPDRVLVTYNISQLVEMIPSQDVELVHQAQE